MRSYPWALSVMPNCSTIKCLPAPGVPLRASLLAAALACLIADGACAQQNPFQSLKDALNQAKQQLQQTTNSTSPAATAAQPTSAAPSTPAPAAPMVAASSATAPSVFAPPSADGPPAAVGPIDPAKMPQINGIHLGEPLADAAATLRKLYSGQGARVDALNGQSMGAQHQAWPQTLRAASDSIGSEEADVDVTYPPNAPVVWHMSRIAHQPNVAHDVLVAALRAKYGKETVALHGGSDAPVTVDRQIMEMYWVYDEQGKLMTRDQSAAAFPLQLRNLWRRRQLLFRHGARRRHAAPGLLPRRLCRLARLPERYRHCQHAVFRHGRHTLGSALGARHGCVEQGTGSEGPTATL